MLSAMITFAMPRCIRKILIPDLQQMLVQLSCKYSSAGWAKSQDKATQQHIMYVCCVYTSSSHGFSIPSTGSGGKTQFPPTTLTVMEWTSIGTLMPTGVWYIYQAPIFYCGTDTLTMICYLYRRVVQMTHAVESTMERVLVQSWRSKPLLNTYSLMLL